MEQSYTGYLQSQNAGEKTEKSSRSRGVNRPARSHSPPGAACDHRLHRNPSRERLDALIPSGYLSIGLYFLVYRSGCFWPLNWCIIFLSMSSSCHVCHD